MPTKVILEIFQNIFNDSGMECSAIYQRPYTEACQLEINPHHASRNKEKKIFSKKLWSCKNTPNEKRLEAELDYEVRQTPCQQK